MMRGAIDFWHCDCIARHNSFIRVISKMKVLLVLALFAGGAFAQDSEAAMQLYNKGVRLLDSGKGDDARKAFQAIVKDYPTSAYSKLAKEGLDKPLIGSVEFVDIKPLSEKEVRKAYEAAGAMAVGRVYRPEDGEQARTLLAQMMMKKKMKTKDIKAINVTAKDLPDKKMAVTIAVVR